MTSTAPLTPADDVTQHARLVSVYGGLLGVGIAQSDARDSLRRDVVAGASTEQTALALAQVLRRAGLDTDLTPNARLDQMAWPALMFMITGEMVLVIGSAGQTLTIYDPSQPGNQRDVAVQKFAAHFSGLALRAHAPVSKLAQMHSIGQRESHWFWGQFTRFRRQIAEIALGSFVANLLAVAVALFALQVYDRVIPHQSEATLWVLAAGAALALCLEAAIKIARARLMDGAGRQIEVSVLHILMQRVLGARSDSASAPASLRFSQMREFGSVREFFTASTIGTLADIPFLFVFLFLVASIAGPVVWVLIAGGLLMVVPGIFLQRRMIRLTQETQGASAHASRLLQETLFDLDTVKTQRAEDRVMRLWGQLNSLTAVKSSEQRKLAASLTFWSQGVQQGTYVAAVICGTYLVFAGSLTVGAIIAVGILTSRTLAPLTGLAGIMARWGNVKTALDGLEDIASAPQDVDAKRSYLRRDALQGEFELREVNFRYEQDGAPVLDLPGFKVLPGQRLAVLGSNGSGKSSFLKLLSGLYAPDQGRVLIDGTDMRQIDPRDLRRAIGYLGQDVRLFSGSLRDNLNLTLLEQDDDRLMAALDFAGLGTFVRDHHKGLDLDIHDAGQGLSIGQRQSIGWARLWLQDPAICLLDEPTAALDKALEQAMVARLGDWLEGRTVVIATHRTPILSLTTRTLVLNKGRMQVDGPQDQVLEHLRSAAVVPLKASAI